MSKILLTAMCVLALGLGACSSSGKEAVAILGGTAAEQRAAVFKAIEDATAAVAALDGESTDADVTAATEAIAAARKAVTDADTLSGTEKDGFDDPISSLDGSLKDKGTLIAQAREDRRRRAAADVERLFTALGGRGIADTRIAVRHGAAPTMSGTVLGTPPTTVADLETAGATGQLGGWRGGTYTADDEAAGTADTVVLYTNIEAPGTQPFSGEGGRYGTANGLDGDGNLLITAGTDATLIASSAFPIGPGIRTHAAGTDGTAEIAGSFHAGRTVTHAEGHWGGALSNISDQDGNPRLVAGFSDAGFEESDGSAGLFYGTLVALSEPFRTSGNGSGPSTR